MKLSTRSRYGVRLLLELALNYDKGALQLSHVARSQEISEKYLGQLVIQLKSAGLITSERGKNGGYHLSRAPKDLTLREIVEKLEGDLSLVDCTEDKSVCNRLDCCVTRDVWCDLSKKISDTLEGITLQDLVDKTYSLKGNLNYEI